jgi:hypothetical protein
LSGNCKDCCNNPHLKQITSVQAIPISLVLVSHSHCDVVVR